MLSTLAPRGHPCVYTCSKQIHYCHLSVSNIYLTKHLQFKRHFEMNTHHNTVRLAFPTYATSNVPNIRPTWAAGTRRGNLPLCTTALLCTTAVLCSFCGPCCRFWTAPLSCPRSTSSSVHFAVSTAKMDAESWRHRVWHGVASRLGATRVTVHTESPSRGTMTWLMLGCRFSQRGLCIQGGAMTQ